MQNGNGRKKGKKEKKIGLRHSTRRLAKRDALLFVNNSVGTILGIDSQRLDSFGDFCGRVRRLDSKVKESIQNRHDSFA
jgi:hypothetical protein